MAFNIYDNQNATLHMDEHAKQAFWECLPEEERQKLCFQAASNFTPQPAPQPSMVHSTPRTMPTPVDTMNLSTPDFGIATHSLSTSLPQRSASANMDWNSTNLDVPTDYTFDDASTRRPSRFQSVSEYLPCANDMLTEWSPMGHSRTQMEPRSSILPCAPIPCPEQTQLTPALPWSPSPDGSVSPSTPSTTALMTPVTYSSNSMSRQSSCNPHFLDSPSMLRVQSDSSCILPFSSADGGFPLSFNNCVDDSLFSSFTDPLSEDFLLSAQIFPANAAAFACSENNESCLAEDMRRTASTTAASETASDASATCTASPRQLRRDRKINARASRKIAPKASDSDDENLTSPAHAQMKRIKSEDGSSKTVGVIVKTPYVRPQHPKIMCQYCKDRPEGFRGTHELDRHIARAHASRRKGYICVDFSPDKKFLANCKHCRNKKVYGAYYNAAAHLRRAHFHPRKRGRKGKNDEKRGGIGGGDDPPMEHLKMHWIKEVEVDNKPSPTSPCSASDEEAPDPTNAAYENDYESESYPAQQAVLPDLTSQAPLDPNQYFEFGMSMRANEPIMYDPNTVANYEHNINATNDLSNFHFDPFIPQ